MDAQRGRQTEVWNWLLQRVTGLFLAYALAIHLWAVHVVNQDQLTWATITARLRDGNAWTIYYALFIPAVVYHACNGLWGIVLDYGPGLKVRRWIGLGLWGGATALLIYGYFGLRPLLGGA